MNTPATTPSVLFVCVKNGGKSQMATALMRQHADQAGTPIEVHSAGTQPGAVIKQLSADVLAEVGADMTGQTPQSIDPDLLARVDRVVVLGDVARVEALEHMAGTIETWSTDESSERGIEGDRRMHLVRDDIDARVRAPLSETTASTSTTPRRPSVLFVCVHNAGRSQMAAGYLRQLGQGRIEVRSAGSEPTDQLNPVAVDVMVEEGIDIASAVPKILSPEAVQVSDVVITMGCGDACPIFHGKCYEDWQLADPAGQSIAVVRGIRDDIKACIQQLISELLPAMPPNLA